MTMASIAALAVLASAGQPAPPAQKSKPEVREIIATGCVRKGAEADCLMLKTLDGATYNILATPTPVPGTVIVIDGKPHRGSTACKQGVPVDVTRWESTGEKCVP